MKKILFILALCSISAVSAQDELKLGTNRSCETAVRVCSSIKQVVQLSSGEQGSNCPLPIDPLYYSFHFAGPETNSLTVLPQYPHSGYYVFYGPFASLDFNVCNQIAANTAPYVTGTFSNTGGSGTPAVLSNVGGYYILMIVLDQCINLGGNNYGFNVGIQVSQKVRLVCNEKLPCENCITSFAPEPGKYLVSGWVKEKNAPAGTTNYNNATIGISFSGSASTFTCVPSGQIIDGWQRIEEVIGVPVGATGMSISLQTSSGTAYFDDIRFFPFDGSMMSYVYDPSSLRLMAELDERNYATLYEYDEEGKLIRVKKETERGIMTIQENRDNITKQ